MFLINMELVSQKMFINNIKKSKSIFCNKLFNLNTKELIIQSFKKNKDRGMVWVNTISLTL